MGMTDAQLRTLARLLIHLGVDEFRHGDCKGSDDEAATLVKNVFRNAKVIALPGPDGEWRAFNKCSDEVRPEMTHFARNRIIVDESDVLLACPLEMEEQPRGGTWYTINHAKKTGKKLHVVLSDGSTTTLHDGRG